MACTHICLSLSHFHSHNKQLLGMHRFICGHLADQSEPVAWLAHTSACSYRTSAPTTAQPPLVHLRSPCGLIRTSCVSCAHICLSLSHFHSHNCLACTGSSAVTMRINLNQLCGLHTHPLVPITLPLPQLLGMHWFICGHHTDQSEPVAWLAHTSACSYHTSTPTTAQHALVHLRSPCGSI